MVRRDAAGARADDRASRDHVFSDWCHGSWVHRTHPGCTDRYLGPTRTTIVVERLSWCQWIGRPRGTRSAMVASDRTAEARCEPGACDDRSHPGASEISLREGGDHG